MDNGSALLATGGIAAIVTAGWQHIKNLYRQLYSIILLEANIDDSLLTVIHIYLRTFYKTQPSGISYYVSRRERIAGRSYECYVPYRLPAIDNLLWRNLQFIWITRGNGSLVLRAIRGTINFEQFISDAIDYYETLLDAKEPPSRFQIITRVGREKGGVIIQTKDSIDSDLTLGDESAKRPNPTHHNGSSSIYDRCMEFNLLIDRSFKYPEHNQTFLQQRRLIDSIYLPDEILAHIERAKHWLKNREWYAERDIPWTLGWMIYGPVGSVKSTLAKAMADLLGLPLYQFYIATMSDQELIGFWRQVERPCVILLEDLDTVFDGRRPITEHKTLTFDCLLNVISGVGVQSGIFLIISTNHPGKIDNALVQITNTDEPSHPGRIDCVIEVGYMTINNQCRMANKILRDWPDLIAQAIVANKQVTSAQFQERCLRLAVTRMQQSKLSTLRAAE